MMSNRDEETAILRAETLHRARELCKAWAYWTLRTNIRTGYEPYLSTGGIERYYAHPQRNHWNPPEPKLPAADENSGLAVQRAFIYLPQLYRNILRAEFCMKPWIIQMREGELDAAIARKARVSQGAYQVTLQRGLLSLANRMKLMGAWK